MESDVSILPLRTAPVLLLTRVHYLQGSPIWIRCGLLQLRRGRT
ncbi:unnamed protein product [Musa hybrid cultivar]